MREETPLRSREVILYPLRQVRDRGASRVLVVRALEAPEEIPHALYRFEAGVERSAFAAVTIVQATREGTTRARAPRVDRACAAIVAHGERGARLLEGAPASEHVKAILTR